jgi:hypothetical protein
LRHTALVSRFVSVLTANHLTLPRGKFSVLTHGRSAGKLLDWNLKKATARYAQENGHCCEDDIANFPIEQVRFVGIYMLIAVSAVRTAAYGVTLNERTVSVFNPRLSVGHSIGVPGAIGFRTDNSQAYRGSSCPAVHHRRYNFQPVHSKLATSPLCHLPRTSNK